MIFIRNEFGVHLFTRDYLKSNVTTRYKRLDILICFAYSKTRMVLMIFIEGN